MKLLYLFLGFICVLNIQAQTKRIDLYVNQSNIEACLTGIESTFTDCSFVLYPNPGTGLFTLETNNLSKEKKLFVIIYDANGKSVMKKELKVSSKTNMTFDLTSQSKGWYILEIKGKKELFKANFILQ